MITKIFALRKELFLCINIIIIFKHFAISCTHCFSHCLYGDTKDHYRYRICFGYDFSFSVLLSTFFFLWTSVRFCCRCYILSTTSKTLVFILKNFSGVGFDLYTVFHNYIRRLDQTPEHLETSWIYKQPSILRSTILN